ncbi:MAG TPA: RsmG family class I SAM-dependent methyltransferase [Thermoleophilia bacterium]|nr:RsmG family class I SAM-dependent methyltransferase [Thermoleophilia bacterium]
MTADAPLQRVLRQFPELGAVVGATDRLAAYAALLAGYERANVTGARGPEGVADLVGDALGLLDVDEAAGRATAAWADLGTGGGLPGIPLALALPRLEVTLIEAVAKKCAFLDEAVAATGLGERVIVCRGRSEDLAQVGAPLRARFAVVLAKAVGSLAVVVELAAPLLAPGGLLLASKTASAAAAEAAGGEAAGAACGLAPHRVAPLPRSPLPGSVCVVFEKLDDTPDRFPRRPGIAAKRPLG